MSRASSGGFFACRPILSVESLPRSLSFYVDLLGFQLGLAWSDGDQAFVSTGDRSTPTFAIIGRGPVQLMLSQRSQGAPGMWLHFDIHTAKQVDALYQEWSGNGVRIFEPPVLRPWGMYEMRVRDPDEHVLRISGPPA